MSEKDGDILREPKTVVVENIDLWAIQKAIKFNTFMLDPRNMKPMFENSDGQHTAWRLRRKVNGLLNRFAAETLSKAMLPLDYDEAWFIDNVISTDAYKGAANLLLQVFQVIWEWEHGVSLKTGKMNEAIEGADGRFSMDSLVEYLNQPGTDKNGWFPDRGNDDGSGV